MKILSLLFTVFLIAISIPITVFAHPGSTDGSGGHYDRSTGEYHYHHGYSAHYHYDMNGDGMDDCPYNFVDRTDTSNRGSSSSEDTDPGTNYSRPSIQPVETKEPEETDSEEVITTKEKKEMPQWGYWVIGILGCIAAIQFLVIRSMSKEIDSRNETLRESLKKNDQLKSDVDSLKKENIQIASNKVEWVRQVKQIERNSEAVIRLKDRRIAILTRKIELIQSEKDKLYQRYPFAKTEPTSPLLTHPVILPNDVYFVRGRIPVKGTVNERNPFGDFTVYVSTKGKKFHSDNYCGGAYLMDAVHVYSVLDTHTPCTKCALHLPFHHKQIPQWYKDVLELSDLI